MTLRAESADTLTQLVKQLAVVCFPGNLVAQPQVQLGNRTYITTQVGPGGDRG